jgi:GDP-6-deoxy-D-talose 4-dehydrogenase
LKILVTGSDGFTGQYLRSTAEALGYESVALKSDLNNTDELNHEVLTTSPDAIVHLAAISFVGNQDLESFYKVNVIGTENLLKAAVLLKHKPKMLIASSANVYGNPSVELIDETTLVSPINHYAISKLAMEYAVKARFSELPIIITRPFNYTGLGQSENFLIPKIVSHFTQKKPFIELGNLDVSRDFSDVRDVTKIYIQLLESKHHSITVNICCGRCISLRDIMDVLHKVSGHSMDIKVNPEFVRKNEIRQLHGDNSFLKSLINLAPFIKIEDTISEMYASSYYS